MDALDGGDRVPGLRAAVCHRMAGPPQPGQASVATMTFRRLASLLLDGAAERPIASTPDRTISLEQFRGDVASTIARIAVVPGRRGLVVCDDAYWATVGMFALAHAGAETVFAPNALPSTLA